MKQATVVKVSPRQTVLPTARTGAGYVLRFEGRFGSFYAFRLTMPRYTALDALTLKNRFANWMLTNLKTPHKLGNGFPNDPALSIANKDGRDLFILMGSLADVRVFETRFKVLGFTPTMKI